jgi:hypothetical protein
MAVGGKGNASAYCLIYTKNNQEDSKLPFMHFNSNFQNPQLQLNNFEYQSLISQ